MLNDFRRQIEDYWPSYVTQHSHPANRQLHFLGNTNLLIWLSLALARRSPVLLAFAVASSYLIAWIGHFYFERNIPATLRHPILAGLCDMIMYYKTWRGEMGAEVAKYVHDRMV